MPARRMAALVIEPPVTEPAAETAAEPAAETEQAFHPDCSMYDNKLEFYPESHEDCLANGCCYLQCEGIVDGRRCTEGGEWETIVHPFGNIRLCHDCGESHCVGSGEEADCELCSYYAEMTASSASEGGTEGNDSD